MAHWYVIGATPERLEEIRQTGHLVDVFDGPVNAEDQTALWRQLSAASPDGLWITWAALEPPELTGLRRLRVAQPGLSIVVEVSADLTPPNADLAQLVGLGIYAIVSETANFADVSARTFTYADAAHWQGGSMAWDDESEPAKPLKPVQFRTIEVEKRISTSARPVLIAVVGVSPGVGTTTMAVAVATLLAGMNHEVALVESLDAPPTLERWSEELPKGVTAFASPAPDPIDLIRRREWAYVVVDAGSIPSWDVIREWQADLTILVGPGDKHRFSRWEPLVKAIPDQYAGAIVAGAVIGGKDGGKVVVALADEGGLTAFPIPENSHKKGKGGDRALRDLLAPVLADLTPRRRWWAQPNRPTPSPLVATSPISEPTTDWKYTPGPTPAPAYMPPVAPPQSLNIQVARPGVSATTRLWRLFRDAVLLWALASIIAWVIDLWNANASGMMPGVGGRFAVWAGWIIQIDRAILHHL